jgi:hypothetical protein
MLHQRYIFCIKCGHTQEHYAIHKHKDDKIKVANISFAYKTRRILKLLKLRGNHLKFDRKDKAEKIT